jgi:hypothetical protein
MIKYILTGTKKISGATAVIKSQSLKTITSKVKDIITINFDDQPNEDYILLESIQITVEIER